MAPMKIIDQVTDSTGSNFPIEAELALRQVPSGQSGTLKLSQECGGDTFHLTMDATQWGDFKSRVDKMFAVAGELSKSNPAT